MSQARVRPDLRHDTGARASGSAGVAPRVLPRISGTETASALAERLAVRAASGAGAVRVHDVLEPLFPTRGLERGHIYGIRGGASVSLLYALVSGATQEGAWFAMVDMPRAGLVAAEQHGIAMHRVLSVSVDAGGSWPSTVGALVDGVDLVAVSSPRCAPAEARRIAARARAAGTVLLVVGSPGAFEIDATMSVATCGWDFDAHAVSREVIVECSGRRVPVARTVRVRLPGRSGHIEAS